MNPHHKGYLGIANLSAIGVIGYWRQELPPRAFVVMAATHIADAGVKTWTLGDADVAYQMSLALSHRHNKPIQVGMIGLPAPRDPEAIAVTLQSILDEEDALDVDRVTYDLDVEPRLDVLARSVPLTMGRLGFTTALQHHPQAKGWTRVANAGACARCDAWADGSVLPASVEMNDHDNCTCTAEIVLEGDSQ